MIKLYIYIISILLCCVVPQQLQAQDTDVRIANDYFLRGEKTKALAAYQQLARNPDNIAAIHTNYLTLLLDMGRFKEAEDYVDRAIRKTEDRLTYKADLGVVFLRSGDQAKADKYFRGLIKSILPDAYRIKTLSDYLASQNIPEYAILSIQELRTAVNNPNIFTLEMANLYRLNGKRDEMVEEYLRYIKQAPGNVAVVKNILQLFLTKPEELDVLETKLYSLAQQYPDAEVYADLLVWVNVQQKNFYGAFTQARAFDKRFRKDTPKTLEIAQLALSNHDYDAADRSFTWIVKEYGNTEIGMTARLGLLRARESKIKRTFPVNPDSVRLLTIEYKKFIAKYPDHPNTHEAILNEALLHGYYLNEKDSTINRLQELVASPRVSPYLKAKAKLELGDMYMLKDEPWESTLLYSQVEKSQRDTPVGYDAKFRNARLSYYRGDFMLSREHLDILKQATTKEIANDAMELGLRIRENTMEDSSGVTLRQYALVEMLLYQNRIKEALAQLNHLKNKEALLSEVELKQLDLEDAIVVEKKGSDVLIKIPDQIFSQSILDDTYWLEANLRMKLGEFDEAIKLCNTILEKHYDDVLADDALFMIGDINENQLHNRDKAMEIYRTFLDKFPGSVYVAEARKRFRNLRGDFQSEKPNN